MIEPLTQNRRSENLLTIIYWICISFVFFPPSSTKNKTPQHQHIPPAFFFLSIYRLNPHFSNILVVNKILIDHFTVQLIWILRLLVFFSYSSLLPVIYISLYIFGCSPNLINFYLLAFRFSFWVAVVTLWTTDTCSSNHILILTNPKLVYNFFFLFDSINFHTAMSFLLYTNRNKQQTPVVISIDV